VVTAATFLQLGVSGLTSGATYALIALGFITIYRASNILNLAQGDFVMLGGMLTVTGMSRLGLPYPLAAAVAVMGTGLIGLLAERLVIHPIRNKPLIISIMATIGISMTLSGSALLLFGTSPRTLPPLAPAGAVSLGGGVSVSSQALAVLLVCLLLLAAFHAFSSRTWSGKAMEAAATDRLGADLVGISRSVSRMQAFFISAALGAVAGVLITPLYFMQYNAGALLGLKGFAAAVIGGWGSYAGAVLGGLVLGVVESLSLAVIPAGYKDAVAFVALLAILAVRSKGLLGSRALEEARK